jgi:hypothetical protein
MKPVDDIFSTLIFESPETIKAIETSGGKTTVGAYAIRFSGPDQKDLTGEFFTANTYLGAHKGDGVDVLFNHGQAPSKAFDEICGMILGAAKATADQVGVFVQHVLDLSDEYQAAIAKLCAAGKLKWSSGATSHMVKRADTGEIQRWPIAEFSYTPTPAEPRLPAISPLKSLAVSERETEELAEVFTKAQWTGAYINDLPDSAFLYIEPGGKKDDDGKTMPRSLRHFPFRDSSGNIDLPHLRNALARIPQSNVSQDAKDKATTHAERVLKEETAGGSPPPPAKSQVDIRSAAVDDPEIQKQIDAEVKARVEQFQAEQEKIQSAVKARTKEIEEIYAIGDKFGKRGEAARFVEENKSLSEFQTFILERLNAKGMVALSLTSEPDTKTMRRKDFDALSVGKRMEFLKSGGKLTE